MIKAKKNSCKVKGKMIDIIMELTNILENDAIIQSLEDMIAVMNVNLLSCREKSPKEVALLENMEYVLKGCKGLKGE